MHPGALTPGQRAHVDQMLALINEVGKAWPFNEQLLNDAEVERIILETPRDGCRRADRAYLIWQNERVVELDHALTEHDLTRQVMATAPRNPQQGCDVCPVTRNVAGIAVIAVPPNLIALVLCPSCANRLDPDVLIPTGGTHA